MKEAYIKLRNVNKQINGNIILNSINLDLFKGKIYGFKGKNGSGKTMLFRAICGFIKVEGSIIINGNDIVKSGVYAENVGVLLENPGFIAGYSGFKNLKYLSEINNKIDDNKIKEVLKAVGLDPEDKKAFKKYSLGMKQKLGIAQAIMEDQEIIILDEPTNALDEESIEKLNKIILGLKEKGKIILLSNHNSEELEEICDEIFKIDSGKIKNTISGEESI
ncbi:ABC-2 type transport system ATP-binding protein [Clostridium collagenovorans DSM 3089]|uniref:ABC-2 type transport system ATP-binding protein n=1 Tax=Clostridium collagenovorans DSM 3089 TaxID=1121306 RepID=A0A1M5X8K9_9CLOT|nr:ATP-binding cassette domain-containing protein [Clostridium collagenovorans]SHH95543.1 ABC-2 type transport system ATP-binding protein [Clostridium collagenovorans DSM 3089]